MARNIDDLENDGFSVYSHGERPIKMPPKSAPMQAPASAPGNIVVVDNQEMLKALAETNLTFQVAVNKLISTLKNKPKSFSLDIERDHQGYMSKISVTLNNT